MQQFTTPGNEVPVILGINMHIQFHYAILQK
jgi:hypothetical protein